MSYHYVYSNGATAVGAAPGASYNVDPGQMSAGYINGATPMYDNRQRQSYSPGSFSSDSESTDDYEYRGRMVTRETRFPRDIVRAPTPPPIIKRVVERAPTPEAPIMERVIIRPQAQEIVERVIEQPRTPPPRIIQKEMQEEAPPPIVRTRVIKVDRPHRSGYSQPGSPYNAPYTGLPSYSNGIIGTNNPYRTHSIVGSVGRPAAFNDGFENNPSFSSASSFEYLPPAPMTPAVPQTTTMMTMPQAQPLGVMHQPSTQPIGMMHQPSAVQSMGVLQQPPVHQQIMYRPVQMQPSIPNPSIPHVASNYVPQNFMYPVHQGMSLGYRPLLQQGRMIPNGMPMVAAGNAFAPRASTYPSQQPMFNPVAQQLAF